MAPKKESPKTPEKSGCGSGSGSGKRHTNIPPRRILTPFRYEEIQKMTEHATKIGKGLYASVVKGKWDKKDVAVKKYFRNQGHGWKIEKNFFEKFEHPHIVKCYGYCEEAYHECLVFDYLPFSLHKKRSVNNMDWKTTLKVLIQATEAIDYLNTNSEQTFIGDLKPDGIRMDKNYNAKLVDFNSIIGQTSFPETHNNYYAAPEISLGTNAHASSDVFSIGTIILELLRKTKADDDDDDDDEEEEEEEEEAEEIEVEEEGKRKKEDRTMGPVPKIEVNKKKKKRDIKKEERTEEHISTLARNSRRKFEIKDHLKNSGCSGHVAERIVQIALNCTELIANKRLNSGALLQKLRDLQAASV